jgi:hypothetical protein
MPRFRRLVFVGRLRRTSPVKPASRQPFAGEPGPGGPFVHLSRPRLLEHCAEALRSPSRLRAEPAGRTLPGRHGRRPSRRCRSKSATQGSRGDCFGTAGTNRRASGCRTGVGLKRRGASDIDRTGNPSTVGWRAVESGWEGHRNVDSRCRLRRSVGRSLRAGVPKHAGCCGSFRPKCPWCHTRFRAQAHRRGATVRACARGGMQFPGVRAPSDRESS